MGAYLLRRALNDNGNATPESPDRSEQIQIGVAQCWHSADQVHGHVIKYGDHLTASSGF